MNASSKSVAKWHLLEEERDLSRRSSKASVKAAKESRRGSKGSNKGSRKQAATGTLSDVPSTPGGPDNEALPGSEIESVPAQAPQTEWVRVRWYFSLDYVKKYLFLKYLIFLKIFLKYLILKVLLGHPFDLEVDFSI